MQRHARFNSLAALSMYAFDEDINTLICACVWLCDEVRTAYVLEATCAVDVMWRVQFGDLCRRPEFRREYAMMSSMLSRFLNHRDWQVLPWPGLAAAERVQSAFASAVDAALATYCLPHDVLRKCLPEWCVLNTRFYQRVVSDRPMEARMRAFVHGFHGKSSVHIHHLCCSGIL